MLKIGGQKVPTSITLLVAADSVLTAIGLLLASIARFWPNGYGPVTAQLLSSRTLLRFLGSEFDTLALAQQLEYRAAHRAAVEEVFDSTFVADEPETFVDQQPSDSAVWHTQALRSDP